LELGHAVRTYGKKLAIELVGDFDRDQQVKPLVLSVVALPFTTQLLARSTTI